MSQLQPLPSTAGHPDHLHGLLNGQHNGAGRQYEPRHHDEIDGSGIVVEGPLLGIEGEAKVAVAKVFGLGKSRAECIRHDGRFGQKLLVHGCRVAPGHVDFVARSDLKHDLVRPANHNHGNISCCTQDSIFRDYRTINAGCPS